MTGFVDWIRLAQDMNHLQTTENTNEFLGSIKCCKFPEWLDNSWLLKKDSGPWKSLFDRIFKSHNKIIGQRSHCS
jgi:hypothetical protein